MSKCIRLSTVTAILTCAVLLFSRAAEAQADSASPALQLQIDTRSERTPGYADQLRLANHSLAGPRAELVSGAIIMTGGSFVTLLGVLVHAQDEGDVQAGTVATLAGGLLSVGVGALLLGHGIHRIHDIKVARHALAFRGAQLAMREGRGAYVGASFGF